MQVKVNFNQVRVPHAYPKRVWPYYLHQSFTKGNTSLPHESERQKFVEISKIHIETGDESLFKVILTRSLYVQPGFMTL